MHWIIETPTQTRQALEARAFHLLLENIIDYAIFFMDASGVISYWNAGAERILGYKESEIIGKPCSVIFTAEDCKNKEPEKQMHRAIETGSVKDERWHLGNNGRRFFASGILVYLKNDKGEHQGFAKILQDSTEKRLSEEILLRTFNEVDLKVKERTQDLEESNHSLLDEASELRAAQRQVKAVLRQLVNIQEEERLRISHDLHDHLGQQVTALRLKAELLKEETQRHAAICERVEEMTGMIKKIDKDVDFLTWELRPANIRQLGLLANLESYLLEWSNHSGIRADLQTLGCQNQSLPEEIEIHLYRIAQESLNNIVKHAGATNVAVLLTYYPDRLVMIIEDDGKGFIPDDASLKFSEKGIGIIGMKERAALFGGMIEIESAPNAGTTIIMQVPLHSAG